MDKHFGPVLRLQQRWFWSFERNASGMFHTHVLVVPRNNDYGTLQSLSKGLSRAANATILGNALHTGGPRITLLKQHGGVTRRIDIDQFIQRYFARKVAHPEPFFQGLKTYILRDGDGQSLQLLQDPFVPREEPGPSNALVVHQPQRDYMSKKAHVMRQNIERMVDRGCVTESKLRSELPDIYWETVAQGKWQMQNMLQQARLAMVQDWTLQKYLVDPTKVPDMYEPSPDNIITKVITHQGYDPEFFCVHLAKWAGLDMCKRNTFALWGVPDTGKTLIHTSLKLVCPIVGCVNKNNDNFPFNMVQNCLMISWEEGLMKKAIVEQAKELMGNEPCDVDRKGCDSVTVQPTPFFMSTNTDTTIVDDGNALSTAHRHALRQRMVQYKFTSPFQFQSEQFPGPYPSEEELKNAIIECASWGVAFRQHLPSPFPTHLPPELPSSGEMGYIAKMIHGDESGELI